MNPWHLREAARTLRAGGVVAYPTEAVFGLGCDPENGHAVYRLLALKQRAPHQGLILIASSISQLYPFIEDLAGTTKERVLATWPGPVTWLVPARPDTPFWLTGTHHTLAVRVTAHAPAAALCRWFGGPLVSTSANLSGRSPARSLLGVRLRFGSALDYLLPGLTGGGRRPSEIRDARSGQVVRSG